MIPLKTNSLYLFNLDCRNSAENLENGSNEIKFLIGGTYRTIYSRLALARDLRKFESR